VINFFQDLRAWYQLSKKRELETGDGDQPTAMEISCSKNLNKLSSQYLHIIKESITISFMVTTQVSVNFFLRWNWKGEHCLGRIFWQLFSAKMVRPVHRKVT